MAEYIDREAAIAYLENHKRVGKEQHFILAANEDAIIKFLKEKCPAADVVKVVRCRDCVRYQKISDACGNCYMTTTIMHPDDYCSRGKRKDAHDA